MTNRIIKTGDGIKVPATSPDSDLPMAFRQRLAFLKIHVEAAELEVLRGTRKIMAASSHLLFLFQRLKHTPIDDLLHYFACRND